MKKKYRPPRVKLPAITVIVRGKKIQKRKTIRTRFSYENSVKTNN